jgi:hypothetical protein
VILAHELSHNYGRLHVDCPAGVPYPDHAYPFDSCMIGEGTRDGFYGFNGTTVTPVSPQSAGDLMAYRSTHWTSSYTYCSLLNHLQPAPGTSRVRCPDSIVSNLSPELAAAAAVRPSPSAPSDHLVVAGVIDRATREVTWDAFYRLTDAKPTVIAETQKAAIGDFEIALLDASGRTLRRQGFAEMTEPSSSAIGFGTLVPYDTRTRRVALRENGRTLATRDVSRNAPRVFVLAPRGGHVCGDSLTVRWQASDADGDALSHVVQYSADDGRTWQALAVDERGTRLTVATGYLAAGDQARIRIVTTDGVNTTTAVSDRFRVVRR